MNFNEIIKKIFYKKAIISKPFNNLNNQKNTINNINKKLKIKTIIKKDNKETIIEKKDNLKKNKKIKENATRNKKNLKSNSNNLISIKQMIFISNNKIKKFSISESKLPKLKTTMSQINILNIAKKEKIMNNLKLSREQKINKNKEKKNISISNIEKSIDKVNKIVDYNTKYVINNPNLKIQTEKDLIIDLESSINKEMDERIDTFIKDKKNDVPRNTNLINKVFEFHTWNSKKYYDNYNNSSLTNYKNINKIKQNIINTDYSAVNSKLIKKNNYKNNMKNLIKKIYFLIKK